MNWLTISVGLSLSSTKLPLADNLAAGDDVTHVGENRQLFDIVRDDDAGDPKA